jgi:acylglycerol lipase
VHVALPRTKPAHHSLNKPEPGTFETADGVRLYYRYWQGKPHLPVVLYLHGIEGHGQWFEHTAGFLNQRGLSVYAPDRRGAGRSEGSRGHLSHYKQFLDDTAQLLELVRLQQPLSPLVLMGNCWGAKAAILLAAAQNEAVPDQQVDALILTCPALKTKCDMDLWSKIRIGFSWLTRSTKLFDIPLTAPMFTDNPAYVQFIEEDSLRLRQASAFFLIETLKLRYLARNAAPSIRLPVLLLQAGEDQIAEVGTAQLWFDSLSSKDKTFRLFARSSHTLDFDACADEYLDVLTGWLLDKSRFGTR